MCTCSIGSALSHARRGRLAAWWWRAAPERGVCCAHAHSCVTSWAGAAAWTLRRECGCARASAWTTRNGSAGTTPLLRRAPGRRSLSPRRRGRRQELLLARWRVARRVAHADNTAARAPLPRSRAFVRALAEDPHLAVPSPTYLLQQAYEAQSGLCAPCSSSCLSFLPHRSRAALRRAVHHFDLYRLSGPEATFNLELAESFASGARVVVQSACCLS